MHLIEAFSRMQVLKIMSRCAPTLIMRFFSLGILLKGKVYTLVLPKTRGPSKIVSIESEEQLNDSLRKAQDESLPALFYFTAAWCGPCKFISPVIGQLSEKYPHVTTYKIDIDKDVLAEALMKLGIHSVPTIHFFQNGKKASEMVGADVKQLNATMEELYK
ncbi:thioredoxin O1, mitochondrial-like isoform X2 [Coffea eugenioides]|uniref:thioredoxin O1, mitochondrial-like isoform X2 n=1 Tax=Coffea eugenioides TaxID=49369 RepID=UPI000F6059A7|nr:thioredoxin O1, mitochondrial-like isoform X2 [Coffea eugenioides]